MEPKEKKAFEPSGLVPRSIVRTFERFRQQLLPGSETAAIREYRISRYQVLVSARCLFTLLIIPIATNWLVSSWLLSPLVEHFWNTQQNEIFLNSYQEERAFAELESFSEKLFFESLLNTNTINVDNPSFASPKEYRFSTSDSINFVNNYTKNKEVAKRLGVRSTGSECEAIPSFHSALAKQNAAPQEQRGLASYPFCFARTALHAKQKAFISVASSASFAGQNATLRQTQEKYARVKSASLSFAPNESDVEKLEVEKHSFYSVPLPTCRFAKAEGLASSSFCEAARQAEESEMKGKEMGTHLLFSTHENSCNYSISQAPSLLSPYDNSLKIKEKVQNKILELAIYYNQQTIISITNIVGDVVSLVTLGCLFLWMKPEITILKSFLIEAIYSLSDTTKSFLLILLTDLLVGFHSPRGWETALELLLKHFGLPENQDFVFLFVATFPVLLDTVFKYWIFRHLNKISPSTVATYHSMIE